VTSSLGVSPALVLVRRRRRLSSTLVPMIRLPITSTAPTNQTPRPLNCGHGMNRLASRTITSPANRLRSGRAVTRRSFMPQAYRGSSVQLDAGVLRCPDDLAAQHHVAMLLDVGLHVVVALPMGDVQAVAHNHCLSSPDVG